MNIVLSLASNDENLMLLSFEKVLKNHLEIVNVRKFFYHGV